MIYMMKNLLAVFLSVFLVSANASGNHDLWFDAKGNNQEVRVNWILADDVTQTCNMMVRLHNPKFTYNANVKACATIARSKDVVICDIYTSRKTSLAILGHEARHCFEGAWHD